MKIDIEILIVALLLVLVFVSGMQAYQLVSLKASGEIVTSQKTSSTSQPASTQQAPAQMVGGC